MIWITKDSSKQHFWIIKDVQVLNIHILLTSLFQNLVSTFHFIRFSLFSLLGETLELVLSIYFVLFTLSLFLYQKSDFSVYCWQDCHNAIMVVPQFTEFLCRTGIFLWQLLEPDGLLLIPTPLVTSNVGKASQSSWLHYPMSKKKALESDTMPVRPKTFQSVTSFHILNFFPLHIFHKL